MANERVNPITEELLIGTFDGKKLECEVTWPETNFNQKLELVEGIDPDGTHLKVLARRVRRIKAS